MALPEPNRESTSFSWYNSPLKTLYHMVWKHHMKKVMLLFLVLLGALILFVFVFKLFTYALEKMG